MFKHMVIPLDGSSYSERALTYGLEIVRDSEAILSLVIVVPSYETMTWPATHLPGAAELEKHHVQLAQEYLDSQVKRSRESGLSDVRGALLHGEIHSEINDYAQVAGADLIVVSTRGLSSGGLSDSVANRGLSTGSSGDQASRVLGSIALKILMTAPCPVLLVRALA